MVVFGVSRNGIVHLSWFILLDEYSIAPCNGCAEIESRVPRDGRPLAGCGVSPPFSFPTRGEGEVAPHRNSLKLKGGSLDRLFAHHYTVWQYTQLHASR